LFREAVVSNKPAIPLVAGGEPTAGERPLAGLLLPHSGRRRLLEAGSLLVVVLAGVAVGGFVLPRFARKADPAAARGRAPTKPGPARPVRPGSLPRPAGDRVKTGGPASAPSPFDTPRVVPRLPAGRPDLALAGRIDREVDAALAAAGVPASPLAGDAEFVRRVHLDLTGRIPTRERTVAFLDSDDPYKRARLIDELLAGPDYGRHFARAWADLLVKRDFDNNKNLKTAPFINWLAAQLDANRGWDRVVADMITATGREDRVPETFFLMANQDNRQPSPAKLAGATANLFMGIQLNCAECHAHPVTPEWGMNDFWGLAAFFGHTEARRGAVGKANNPSAPATIVEVEWRTPPRGKGRKGRRRALALPAVIRVPDPTDPVKTLGTATARLLGSNKPVGDIKVPYRPHLAGWLTSERNPYFARAAVNRLWAKFFARGLVNPVDEMHGRNRPSHPGLLALLAGAFTRSGFDQKYLIRAICNSRAYQRTSRPLPGNKADETLLSHMPVKVLGARELLDSLEVATGVRRPGTPLGRWRDKELEKSPAGSGGDPLVRFFDTRGPEDDPTEFSLGVPQLLRLMNSRLSAGSEAVADRLVRAHGPDVDRVLEEMYLRALARRPSAGEVHRLADFVARRGDRRAGFAAVYWALLNSAEFMSNH
jgi:hypothetical protein